MKSLKDIWPALVFLVAALVALAIAAVLMMRSCDSEPSTGPDYLEDMKTGIVDDVTTERAENDARIEQLEAEVYGLRLMVEALDEAIVSSVEQREEIHDAIENAVTIDDIDRILGSGTSVFGAGE